MSIHFIPEYRCVATAKRLDVTIQLPVTESIQIALSETHLRFQCVSVKPKEKLSVLELDFNIPVETKLTQYRLFKVSSIRCLQLALFKNAHSAAPHVRTSHVHTQLPATPAALAATWCHPRVKSCNGHGHRVGHLVPYALDLTTPAHHHILELTPLQSPLPSPITILASPLSLTRSAHAHHAHHQPVVTKARAGSNASASGGNASGNSNWGLLRAHGPPPENVSAEAPVSSEKLSSRLIDKSPHSHSHGHGHGHAHSHERHERHGHARSSPAQSPHLAPDALPFSPSSAAGNGRAHKHEPPLSVERSPRTRAKSTNGSRSTPAFEQPVTPVIAAKTLGLPRPPGVPGTHDSPHKGAAAGRSHGHSRHGSHAQPHAGAGERQKQNLRHRQAIAASPRVPGARSHRKQFTNLGYDDDCLDDDYDEPLYSDEADEDDPDAYESEEQKQAPKMFFAKPVPVPSSMHHNTASATSKMRTLSLGDGQLDTLTLTRTNSDSSLDSPANTSMYRGRDRSLSEAMSAERTRDPSADSSLMSPSIHEAVEGFFPAKSDLPTLPPRHQFEITGEDCNTYRFDIDDRYYPLKLLGQGVTGVVISATDQRSDPPRQVAIKKVEAAFEDSMGAKRLLREIRMMSFFHHENVIALLDLVEPPMQQQFTVDDIYMVMEHMDTDLRKVIHSEPANEITIGHVQFFMWQALRGLEHLHSYDVLHRDIKPSNLLLSADCTLKVCDLGLARGYVEGQQDLTEYVVSRSYRCPELLLGTAQYDGKIDVWSMGCILGELLNRKILFDAMDVPGQLDAIFSVLGAPSEEDLESMANEKARAYYRRQAAADGAKWKPAHEIRAAGTKIWAQLFPDAPEAALDLLSKMLALNPAHRLTATEALMHPFLDAVRTAHAQTFPGAVTSSLGPHPHDDSWQPFEFHGADAGQVKKSRLRELLWQEIALYRPFVKPYLRSQF